MKETNFPVLKVLVCGAVECNGEYFKLTDTKYRNEHKIILERIRYKGDLAWIFLREVDNSVLYYNAPCREDIPPKTGWQTVSTLH